MNDSIMIDTKEGIELYRLLALKYRLKMELSGMKFRDGSTYAMVKKEFGLKGNKQKVYDQFCAIIEGIKDAKESEREQSNS